MSRTWLQARKDHTWRVGFFLPSQAFQGFEKLESCGELLSNMQGSSTDRACVTTKLQLSIKRAKSTDVSSCAKNVEKYTPATASRS